MSHFPWTVIVNTLVLRFFQRIDSDASRPRMQAQGGTDRR